MTEALVQSILNRFLQKYLKNVTTEHATVWGGQLVFKNVELRLDVLQEEVGLPVVIQRGFVQELKVFLPLANLLREPIQFTFSNVEVVARRPETLDVARSPSALSKTNAKGKSGASSQNEQDKTDEDGAQKEEGWMRSLLSRIALNLRVEVRNVVIKYCTDEYVSCVSWKRLTVEPTNSMWQHVFADLEGPTRAAFKEIVVEDITWCLDAVDAGGGGPRFQPPLFNRERMRIRVIARKLPDGPPSHPGYPLGLPMTQVHIRSEKVCLTMSRSQLEMMVRLVEELDAMITEIKRNKRRHLSHAESLDTAAAAA
eukprot:CAMPEP_0181297034 /NCGR_PEP_ID=MMETSP1101-20121128/5019_1 /TAXON_ID=46948 /ORGANISM="Rhodomonas abbreviata, Strain Caron Lab Isolate" /LENGTH=311 /DNA_ID=CAMNT_0023401933 /DNA_START=394 /DNA_END=1326 /DNA_ORIENTATION=+